MIAIVGWRADLITLTPAAIIATAVTAASAARYAHGANRCGGGGSKTPVRILTMMKDKPQPERMPSTEPPKATNKASAQTKAASWRVLAPRAAVIANILRRST